jgi:hypothetical protein
MSPEKIAIYCISKFAGTNMAITLALTINVLHCAVDLFKEK